MSVRNGSGKFEGRTTVVTRDLRTYCTACGEITSWNWRNQGTAAELKRIAAQFGQTTRD